MAVKEFGVPVIVLAVLFGCLRLAAGTKIQNLGAHVGQDVELPCRVDNNQCGNLHSVKWYKGSTRIYVLSHQGVVKRPEGEDAKNRMDVNYFVNSDAANLKISHVTIDDQATYKCEITYLEVRESCDVVQIVNVTTLIKPTGIRIVGPGGITLENGSLLGPKQEGDEIDLVCEAGSGKPIPRVSWYNDTSIITRAQYTMSPAEKGEGSARSTLKLTLQRGDLNAKFECRVESDALDQPISNSVKIDIQVPPTNINITGAEDYVRADMTVTLDCNVTGARPQATIKWFNGTKEISPELVETLPYDNRDGTFTTISTWTFRASHYENGMKVHCYASNEVTKRKALPELHYLKILEVRYQPVVKVKPRNITVIEATEQKPQQKGIYLSCSYKANPQELKAAWWTKDGENITLTSPKFKGGVLENPPLFINNATREDMGEYVCNLRNEIGVGKSEDSIYLDVQYPPDVEVIMEPTFAVRELDKATVYLSCNVTAGNPFNITKVRWYLNKELLQELPNCKDGIGRPSNEGDLCDIDTAYLSLGLENITRQFAGNYTCQGLNEAGWGPMSEYQELKVYYPPSPAKLTSQPSDRVVKGGSLKLICSVDDLGNPENVTYKWFRGSHQLTEVTTNEYNIARVGLETRSTFTCIAVNEGGESLPANKSINVTAPPQFFNKLLPYKGVLYNSEYINLTCRFECSPKCSVLWKKDGRIMDFRDNYFYYTNVTEHPPDRQKNMFESVESTLVWNMTTWGNKINKTTPNSNYTCQSQTIDNGLGPSSTIEIVIDYPPEDVKVNPSTVNVVEGGYHQQIKCSGKGQPQTLEYKWKKTNISEPFALGDTLNLGQMYRNKSGLYICEASNKHGSQQATVYILVQYAPECTLTRGKNKEGEPALICTVIANPQQVDFEWTAKEGNDTIVIDSKERIQKNGLLESILTLDPSIDTRRTYYCRANNTVGSGNKTCEMVVDGILPWWKALNHENLIIIIASIVAIIICVIIICIVIIVLCRRKRASTKYNSPLEMEEREKPDGHSPLPHDQSKWPLKPGLLIHVGKMNQVNISQLNLRSSPFKTTSVSTRAYLKLRRNKSKVYARLRSIREALCMRRRNRTPLGFKEGDRGVVTFKKIKSSPIPPERTMHGNGTVNSRKRKKPGDPPLKQSSGGADKIRPPVGSALQVGNMQDPHHYQQQQHPMMMTKIPLDPHSPEYPLMNAIDPNDKGFYENLPYHGMQNPPNKPISIIAPFNQGPNQCTNQNVNQNLNQGLSNRSLNVPQNPILNQTFPSLNINRPVPNLRPKFNSVRRNQSFGGFQNSLGGGFNSQLLNWQIQANFAMSNSCLNTSNLNLYPSFHPQLLYPPFLPQFPKFTSQTRLSTLSIPKTTTNSTKPQATEFKFNAQANTQTSNPFDEIKNSRIQGRNETNFALKRTTSSGILLPEKQSEKNNKKSGSDIVQRPRKAILSDKRFGSLKTEKHKCYSPTFYSMRCKKHAKKRPIVYALPKRCLSQKPKNKDTTNSKVDVNKASEGDFQNLTDSIQILEEASEKERTPVPAPRCKKHKKPEIIYANICNSLQRSRSFGDSPNRSNDSDVGETSVIEAQVHVSGNFSDQQTKPYALPKYESTPNIPKSVSSTEFSTKANLNTPKFTFTPKMSLSSVNFAPKPFQSGATFNFMGKTADIIAKSTERPKMSLNFEPTTTNYSFPPKATDSTLSPMAKISPQAMKNSPVLKVSPNFIKPKIESPKGALQTQIEAKRKASPAQSPLSDRNVSIASRHINDHNKKESLGAVHSTRDLLSPNLVRSMSEISKKENKPEETENPNVSVTSTGSPRGALSLQIEAKTKTSSMSKTYKSMLEKIRGDDKDNSKDESRLEDIKVDVKQMPILTPQKPARNLESKSVVNILQNAFYTLTSPHCKQQVPPPQYSTIPHPKHTRLTPKALFQEQIAKSKSFSSKQSKNKKPFQIPLQKCQSFKFQTAESYFQPIKNIHEQDLMRNGYNSDYQGSSTQLNSTNSHLRPKRVKPKQKTKGPLVLMHPSDVDIPNSVQLQYPQPVLGSINTQSAPRHSKHPNGVLQYVDLDMTNGRKSSDSSSASGSKSKKPKSKTEYATLKFNEIGQEIDV